MRLLRNERGQATVMVAVFMVGMIGMAAFVLDVGSWFRGQRVSQTTVDAAALAAAQSLPGDTTTARTLATDYATKNGGVAGTSIVFRSSYATDDTVVVTKTSPAPGFFSNIFGISTVNLHATATAISEVPTAAKAVAPIVVNIKHPDLSGPGCPCFNAPTTLPLGKTGAPGSFTMLDLDNTDPNGIVGASTLADWITNGYDKYLDLGQYFSDPGAKFNNSQIQGALQARYNSDLLFPVYDQLVSQGSNAEYHIIGWVGFHLTDVQASGTTGTLTGYFTQVIWAGLVPEHGPPSPAVPDLGVHSVALID